MGRRMIPKERDWPERLTAIPDYYAQVTEGAYQIGETRMDEMTKQTWGIIIRSLIQWGAGAMGMVTFFTPDVLNAFVTVALAVVGFGMSYVNKKKLVAETGM